MYDDTYPSPIDLPERKLGNFEIKHRYVTHVELVDLREAIMTGRLPRSVELEAPRRITELLENGSRWIFDDPREVRQHEDALRMLHPTGRVLVGGLGLGIATTMLIKNPHVTQVDVVEISPEVVELCAPHDPKVNIIVGDINEFLRAQPDWVWSCGFIDTWTDTSEGTWWSEVMPLRRLIGSKFGIEHNLFMRYWAEDVMLAQVCRRLTEATQPHWYYKEALRLPMSKQRLGWFLRNIGSPRWEKRYGYLYPELKPTPDIDKATKPH